MERRGPRTGGPARRDGGLALAARGRPVVAVDLVATMSVVRDRGRRMNYDTIVVRAGFAGAIEVELFLHP